MTECNDCARVKALIHRKEEWQSRLFATRQLGYGRWQGISKEEYNSKIDECLTRIAECDMQLDMIAGIGLASE